MEMLNKGLGAVGDRVSAARAPAPLTPEQEAYKANMLKKREEQRQSIRRMIEEQKMLDEMSHIISGIEANRNDLQQRTPLSKTAEAEGVARDAAFDATTDKSDPKARLDAMKTFLVNSSLPGAKDALARLTKDIAEGEAKAKAAAAAALGGRKSRRKSRRSTKRKSRRKH